MRINDEVASANRQLWEDEVRQRCGYTTPWLDLGAELLRQFAAGELDPVPRYLYPIYPAHLLRDVAGKEVLCLASGGGQQSAVFGLLGAHVTVVDLAEGQLQGDCAAAAHYGYPVTTIQADMRDLSGIDANSFDLVFQADSLAYIPDVRQVYGEVARVLRPGGIYRVAHSQPAVHFVDWSGAAYYITAPYEQRIQHREDGGIEFRHRMDDIFNGLLDAGFAIRRVQEAPFYQHPDPAAQPGDWTHHQAYVAGAFAIIARMP